MRWGEAGTERHAQLMRAASDTGCVPSLMIDTVAKHLGLEVQELTQQEKDKVRAIDGTVSSRIYGRTEPVTIVLCEGTPHEVALRAPRGVLVVRGAEAASMYDMVIGRDLLDQVSGSVFPVIEQFMYLPRLQQGDLSMHCMPVLGARRGGGSGNVQHAATLTGPPLYLPACAMSPCLDNVQGVVSEPATTANTGGEPAAAAAGAALTATDSDSEPPGLVPSDEDDMPSGGPHAVPYTRYCVDHRTVNSTGSDASPKVRRVRRRKGRTAVPTAAPVSAAAAAAGKIWAGVSSTTACMLVLFLWPVMWLFQQLDSCAGTVWTRVYKAAVQSAPRKGTTFWRLGRSHRSATGETIFLRTDPGSSGRKPRSVRILRPCLTLRYVASSVTAKLLLLLIMFAAAGVTGTQAMHTYRGVTADSTSLSLGQHLVPPLPYSVAHLLAAGLTDHLGTGSAGFRQGGW